MIVWKGSPVGLPFLCLFGRPTTDDRRLLHMQAPIRIRQTLNGGGRKQCIIPSNPMMNSIDLNEW